MPTTTLYRKWCAECQDYTLHRISLSEETRMPECTVCDATFHPTPLSEIPCEKILEQRARYKQWQLANSPIKAIFNAFNPVYETIDMLRPADHIQFTIVETDAGQKAIDEKAAEERQRIQWEKRKAEMEKLELKEKMGNARRNDRCPCGSGKKYKHCCLIKTL